MRLQRYVLHIMRDLLKSAHPFIQLLVLVALGLAAMFVCQVLVVGVAVAGGWMDAFSLDDFPGSGGDFVFVMKWLQTGLALGLFVAPYLVYKWLLRSEFDYGTGFRHFPVVSLMAFGMVIFVAFPAINWMGELNSRLDLPDIMQDMEEWMIGMENQAQEMVRAFLVMDTPVDFVINLFVLAVVPAVTEELFFRGTVQPLLHRWLKNAHVAIWVTAFVFSFFHLQFLGFFPRLLLGIGLGYAAFWSGNLWVPIAGHFVNNGMAVVLAFIVGIDAMESEFEVNLWDPQMLLAVAGSLAMAGFGMWVVYRNSPKAEEAAEEDRMEQ